MALLWKSLNVIRKPNQFTTDVTKTVVNEDEWISNSIDFSSWTFIWQICQLCLEWYEKKIAYSGHRTEASCTEVRAYTDWAYLASVELGIFKVVLWDRDVKAMCSLAYCKQSHWALAVLLASLCQLNCDLSNGNTFSVSSGPWKLLGRHTNTFNSTKL